MCCDWLTLLVFLKVHAPVYALHTRRGRRQTNEQLNFYRFHNVPPRNSKDKYTVPVHMFHHVGIARHNHLRKEKKSVTHSVTNSRRLRYSCKKIVLHLTSQEFRTRMELCYSLRPNGFGLTGGFIGSSWKPFEERAYSACAKTPSFASIQSFTGKSNIFPFISLTEI